MSEIKNENKGRYAVIITCERDILCVHCCDIRDAAIAFANRALDNWMRYAKGITLEESADNIGDGWQPASASNDTAWCNFCGENWDAHIVDLEAPRIGIDPFEPKSDGEVH